MSTIIVRTVGETIIETIDGYVKIKQDDLAGDRIFVVLIPMELIPRFCDAMYQHLSDFKQSEDGDAS